MDTTPPYVGFSTLAIHAGQEPESSASSAVVAPVVTATTFKLKAAENHNQSFCYARSGNPTRHLLEKCLAALERSKYALAFASGMSAVSSIVSLISAGDHLLTSADIYGGSLRLFREVVERMGVEVSYVDFTDLDSIRKGIQTNTKMIWLETPSNPLMKVVDIEAITAVAREQTGIIVVVDNTFLTPYYQSPLELGADIAMYSITKYMNGHSDVIMGSAAMNDEGIWKRLNFLQKSIGAVPSPWDCYLVNRSLKTLVLRLERHRKNSLLVAQWLLDQPSVLEVMHPELPNHPQLAITKKQARGHSGVLSFRHSGCMAQSTALLSSLRIFSLAESLGGYESLAQLPCAMSHGSVPVELKERLGITDSLVRLSVGLEDPEDLISDLDQAFKKAFPPNLKIE